MVDVYPALRTVNARHDRRVHLDAIEQAGEGGVAVPAARAEAEGQPQCMLQACEGMQLVTVRVEIGVSYKLTGQACVLNSLSVLVGSQRE